MHEMAHVIGAGLDPALLKALGFTGAETSDKITGKLSLDCFGVKK